MSFTAQITDTLKISGDFGYTRIEFDNYSDPFSGERLDGHKIPYVPRFNFNIAGIYRHPTGYYARTDLLWTGKTFYDAANSNEFLEQDYPLLNIVLGYGYKNFDIKAYVYNLTKTEYFTTRVTRLNLGTPGLPRTFGVGVSMKLYSYIETLVLLPFFSNFLPVDVSTKLVNCL